MLGFSSQIEKTKESGIHGFKIHKNVENIAVVGFADDTTIITKDLASSTTLMFMAKKLFSTIRMQINPKKYMIIKLENGQLVPVI